MKKEVKKVPALRFPEFDGDWDSLSLGQLLSFKNGINANKEKYGKGVKFINVLDIINNRYITHDSIIGCVEVTDNEYEKNKVEYGDILFQRSSETREEVGQTNVYLDKERNAVFGGFVIRGKKKKNYQPIFMNFLLGTWSARKEITTKSGGSTRYNVGQNTLSEVNIISPTLPEQQKIASFLSVVDTKITQLTRKKKLLEQYKKGVMQKIFSQEIRFKDDNGQDYPDWEEKRLGEIGSFYSGGTPDSTDRTLYTGAIPFIKSGEINCHKTHQHISETALQKSSAKIVNKGDLLYALYGATAGELAMSKIYGAINQAVLCIKSSENVKYLFYYLSMKKKWILATYLQGGQGNLSATIIKALEIPVPNRHEQQKIANLLSSIDDKINTVQTQLSQTQNFKKGLLQKMFV